MPNKNFTLLKKHWKDLASAGIAIALTIASIIAKYNLGMLIGFLILFAFFSFDRIKRIIFEMNVRKIFGIEFGEIDKELLKERVREDVEKKGIVLTSDEIDVVTDVALNQVTGVAHKARFYDEIVYYALKDLDTRFLKELSGAVGNDRFYVDFVIEINNARVIGIEATYSDRRYLSSNKVEQIIKNANAFKKADNLSHFVLITNSEVKDEDKKRLQAQQPPIDVIENVVSPDGILSGIDKYLGSIDRDRKGSLEPK
ncbi:MAG: hypothetical protein FJ106_01595 [Deltaproteobacteria bacterium]|nr:hypothetical protein [Deltaproteobacteria bacterium]